MLNLIPKRPKFAALFSDLASTVSEGASLLAHTLQVGPPFQESILRLREIEHRGDEITHSIYKELNRTFITPFDREDIYRLAASLDDVLDFANTAGQVLVTYKIADPTPPSVELAGVIVLQCQQLADAVRDLHDGRRALQHCQEISELERSADAITREAIAALFATGTDPIELIKLKDLYGFLEQATDKAEDAANVIEAIVVKQM